MKNVGVRDEVIKRMELIIATCELNPIVLAKIVSSAPFHVPHANETTLKTERGVT